MVAVSAQQVRETRPANHAHLRAWVKAYTGLAFPERSTCDTCNSPYDSLATAYFARPSAMLVLGPRGGGKSLMSALLAHLNSRFDPRHGTRVLGGSGSQSMQIQHALESFVVAGRGPRGTDKDSINRWMKARVAYQNGSEITILTASPTSVRGPHVPSLNLDEVDEIDERLRDASLGMCMGVGGRRASVLMTSTWHNPHGPMSDLVARASSGDFVFHKFCIFDVLERCPEERSGPNLEKCPECPLHRWCVDGPVPKAKRSSGHYSIDALIQKVRMVSARTFEADYLCLGPKPDGLWFPDFARDEMVADVDYDLRWPVHVAIDCGGNYTGAVIFQIIGEKGSGDEKVHVICDYLSVKTPAFVAAQEVKALIGSFLGGVATVISADSAGGAHNPIGPSVIAEYQRGGLGRITLWPRLQVADGLALVESFMPNALGESKLLINPRCGHTIQAFENYRRARVRGQWLSYPEDPQHPYEELIDSLRGGLATEYPSGRFKPKSDLRYINQYSIGG